MKQIWPNYSYSPTTNVLTLTGLNIDRDQLLLVSAPERGRIMYNFADSTVTASAFTAGANTGLTLVASTAGLTTTAALVIYYDDQVGGISGTVTVGNSVNINSLPSIRINPNYNGQDGNNGPVVEADNNYGTDPRYMVVAGGLDNNNQEFRALNFVTGGLAVAVTTISSLLINTNFYDVGSVLVGGMNAFGPLQTSVTSALPAGTNQIGSVTASISNSVTIASLPAISGTVTANSSNGSLTTRFGSVTTANTAFATSAVTNANRKYLLIQNVTTASNVITVGIGFTPTTTQGIQLSSGAGLTFEGNYIPTGAVNLLSSVTASCFTILEA